MLHCQAEGYPVPTVVWKRAMGWYLTRKILQLPLCMPRFQLLLM